MASKLYQTEIPISEYYLRDHSPEEAKDILKNTTTLYIGNLSFFTNEIQLYELFSKCGDVKRIIMGLNRNTKTPCGFCFVEYYTRKDANMAVTLLNNTQFDGRVIRVDWDAGFTDGRQFGRGHSGAQVRDDRNRKYDPDRPTNKSNRNYGNKRNRDRYEDDYPTGERKKYY
jgi:nuclear cap-binding protein subunit 2